MTKYLALGNHWHHCTFFRPKILKTQKFDLFLEFKSRKCITVVFKQHFWSKFFSFCFICRSLSLKILSHSNCPQCHTRCPFGHNFLCFSRFWAGKIQLQYSQTQIIQKAVFRLRAFNFYPQVHPEKITYECYMYSSAKHCCPLSSFTSTPCYHTPTYAKLTCAHVKNKPRKLTPLGLYMPLCASVNPALPLYVFMKSVFLLTSTPPHSPPHPRTWQRSASAGSGCSERVGASGQGEGRWWGLCRCDGWAGCCRRIWPLHRSSREGVVCYISLMSFCRQARLWGRLISKYDSERSPCRLLSTTSSRLLPPFY